MHNMLSLLSLRAAVSQKQQAENQLLHLLRVHEEEKSASILYIFFLLFFVLMRSYDRIGWESPGLICGISAKKRLSLSPSDGFLLGFSFLVSFSLRDIYAELSWIKA
jgi:hypothetical protein